MVALRPQPLVRSQPPSVFWGPLSPLPMWLSHLQHPGLPCCLSQSDKPTHRPMLVTPISTIPELSGSQVTAAMKAGVTLYTMAFQALRGSIPPKRRGSPCSCEISQLVSLTPSHSQGHGRLALSNALCMEAAIETGGATAGLIKGIVGTVLGSASEEVCRWQILLNYRCERPVN